jgi:uncharacterized protein YjiK
MNHLCLYIALLIFLACKEKQDASKNPPGYDLRKPEKFLMPDVLNEVSGICFYKGKNDTLYAGQDEDGQLFYLPLGDKKAAHTKFGKKGDYEDLAIVRDQVIILRSDGTLFSFPFAETKQEEITTTKEWKDLVPSGEYEGLYADETDGKIYVLCKQCKKEKSSETSVYILQLQSDGSITQSSSTSVNVKAIENLSGDKKVKFFPSALAKNPQTQEWYILSSVNKLLVVADNAWNVKEVYPLDPSLYRQPEGITFDSDNNLYISNEGDAVSKGNVLKFVFNKHN